MQLYYVYMITNVINNKRYVGVSKNPKQRFKQHAIKHEVKTRSLINQAIRKYGKENFILTVLHVNTDEGVIYNTMETGYIKQLNTMTPNGYNIVEGGNKPPTLSGKDHPMYGRKHSEDTLRRMTEIKTGKVYSTETRRKISEATTGTNNPFFGKTHEDKTRRRISEANKGRPAWNKGKTDIYTEDTKRKISETHRGKVISEEHKRILSEVGKRRVGAKNPMYGKNHSEETRRQMSETRSGANNNRCKTTKEMRLTIKNDTRPVKEIATEYNLGRTTIYRIKKEDLSITNTF